MNLFIIFLTGLTTGGLSCLALQGGLLAGVIANQAEINDQDPEPKKKQTPRYVSAINQPSRSQLLRLNRSDWGPVLMFLLAKLVTHTILGFFLGWLGATLTLSLQVRLLFQAFTGLFMIATAMNLLDVHPAFRFLSWQPPKFLQRSIRRSSKSRHLFAPAILGALTIFIPCGVTQAMEVLAINTGNPATGALIMFSFVLGTSPLFALLGVATAKLSDAWYTTFSRIAAIVLIFMGLYSVNGVLIVTGSPLALTSLPFLTQSENGTKSVAQNKQGVQKITLEVLGHGYEPNFFQVKANQPVELTLVSNGTYSCALAFVFRDFGINTFLDPTDKETFTFTPTKPGRYTYTCSMGMYTGVMEVI